MLNSPIKHKNKVDTANETRCPICQGGFLQIHQGENEEDFMTCPGCGVKFKITSPGGHLMLVEGPINFPKNLVGLWLTRAQIGKVLHEQRVVLDNNGIDELPSQNPVEIPKSNPMRAQAVRQARKWIAAGKPVYFVHQTLSKNMQLTEFAIEEIIKDAIAVNKTKKLLKRQRVLDTIIICFIILIALAVIVIILFA